VSAAEGAEGRGWVIAVCSGPGGLPKFPRDSAIAGPLGLDGDAHRFHGHGGPDRALCLLSEAEAQDLARDGVSPTAPGAFGENLRLGGLDLRRLRPGDRLRIGEQVRVELFDVREPCRTLRSLDPRFPDLMLGRSGYVARVLVGGEIRPGQEVRIESAGRGS
jgi:MOSC domain-containing protein YiiM